MLDFHAIMSKLQSFCKAIYIFNKNKFKKINLNFLVFSCGRKYYENSWGYVERSFIDKKIYFRYATQIVLWFFHTTADIHAELFLSHKQLLTVAGKELSTFSPKSWNTVSDNLIETCKHIDLTKFRYIDEFSSNRRMVIKELPNAKVD